MRPLHQIKPLLIPEFNYVKPVPSVMLIHL